MPIDRLVKPDALGQGGDPDSGVDVVVVGHLGGVLPRKRAQNSSHVLHETSLEADRCREDKASSAGQSNPSPVANSGKSWLCSPNWRRAAEDPSLGGRHPQGADGRVALVGSGRRPTVLPIAETVAVLPRSSRPAMCIRMRSR
jgi:hypothetical protein